MTSLLKRRHPDQLDDHLVERLTGSIGAVVHTADLGPGAAVQLRHLVARHGVVFVRDFGTDEARFTELAAAFGEFAVHPLHQFSGRVRTVAEIEDSAAHPPAGFPWHTDLSWMERPPRFGFLQALEIPPFGGDTMWSSLRAAHDALSPALREMCSRLDAVHAIDDTLLATVAQRHGDDIAARFQRANPSVEHPLLRAHPDTGEPLLFICPMYAQMVTGLTANESTSLLDLLAEIATDPNRTVRWRWRTGDLAIWDEATTIHRALVDHHPARRRMRRCTTVGPRVLPAYR
jgi:taurine dioxygenase